MKINTEKAKNFSRKDIERPSKIYSCLEDEEIFITGFAFRGPESEDMQEFKENLLSAKDMITVDDRKFPAGFHAIPSGMGKMKDCTKLDATFFNLPAKFVNTLDPQCRMAVELTYEAIADSGYDPKTLKGSRTGVFVGNILSDGIDAYTEHTLVGYTLLGSIRTMFSSRIGYYFDFKGLCYSVDSSCVTSMTCLENAVQYIRNGMIDNAIIASLHMITKPASIMDFVALGLAAPDSKCKVFDAAADGFSISEAMAVTFIQRSSGAKRCYFSILHIKSNSDGYKKDGIISSESDRKTILIKETYKEAGVDPKDVVYLEANGSGTQADVDELNMITDIFCKDRQGPLLIGSVKSNIGHCEASAGLCQLAKLIIASEEGIIPPNLHYHTPNPKVPGLTNGSLKVVTEPTPWKGGIIAVNTFGIDGNNCHTILKSHDKKKIQSDEKSQMLVAFSGRTSEAVDIVLSAVESNPDIETIELLKDLMDHPSVLSCYRGYTILHNENSVKEIKHLNPEKRPLWYVFSGMGCQWIGMGRDMMQIEVFRNSMLRCHQILKPMGIELIDLIMTTTEEEFESTIINAFVTIGAIQVALVDCLKELGLEPDGILGHSLGELGCAYADGGFTAEETLLASYWRGHCVYYGDLPPGAMAAVGLSAEEVLQRCPPGVVAACHNSKESVTISGPPEPVNQLIEELKAENIFVRKVRSTGKAFHCYMVNKIAPNLLSHLEELIPDPKMRTPRWISTSVLQEDWENPVAKYCSGVYFANNLVNHVYFSEAMELVPKNAIVIEIGPHCLLQSIVKQMLTTDATYLGLQKRNHPDNLQFFLEALGNLYTAGYNFKISTFLPKAEFPVSRGTAMISPLIKFDHSTTWPVSKFHEFLEDNPIAALSRIVTLKPTKPLNEDAYLLDYVIDRHHLVPFSKYLDIVWQTFAKSNVVLQNQIGVHFENLQVHKYVPILGDVRLHVNVIRGSGRFYVLHDEEIVFEGNVYGASKKEPIHLAYVSETKDVMTEDCDDCKTDDDFHTDDVYKTLHLCGYEYGSTFQGILNVKESHSDDVLGDLKWNQNWTAFIDSIFQFVMFKNGTGELRLPEFIQALRISPTNLMVEGAPSSKPAPTNVMVENSSSSQPAPTDVMVEDSSSSKPAPTDVGLMVEDSSSSQPAPTDVMVEDSSASKLAPADVTVEGASSSEKNEDEPTEIATIIPIWGNLMMNTFVAGDVQLKGLKTKVVSRNQYQHLPPILEEYSFIPFEEKRCLAELPELEKDLHDYNAVCCNTIMQLCQKLLNARISDINQGLVLSKLSELASLNACVPNKVPFYENSFVMKTLEDLLKLPVDKIFKTGYCSTLENPSFMNDKLVSSLLHWRALKPCLDIVADTVTNKEMVIVEIDASKNSLMKGFLKVYSSLNLKVNYTLTDVTEDIVSSMRLKIPDVTCDVWDAQQGSFLEGKVDLILVKHTLIRYQDALPKVVQDIAKSLKNGGFALFYEMMSESVIAKFLSFFYTKNQSVNEEILNNAFSKANLTVVAKKSDGIVNQLFLVRKVSTSPSVQLSVPTYAVDKWLPSLKKHLKDKNAKFNLWLISEHEPVNGISGLVSCLRKEGYNKIRCIIKNGKKTEKRQSLHETVMKKDLFVSVWENETWGSYHYLPLKNSETSGKNKKVTHAHLIVNRVGDLSSIKWVPSPYNSLNESEKMELCDVYYACIQKYDVDVAVGKLPQRESKKSELFPGIEFSGRNANGQRVMGCVSHMGLATTVKADPVLTWVVPNHWTLEQAATVPVAYTLAYFALVVKGRLQSKHSVFTHYGCGSIGLAIISIALDLGCTVYTTVGSKEKRNFLKERFPTLTDENIANSRDASFECHIMKQTKGKGVDIVVSSVTGSKLHSTFHLVGNNGAFIQIGKYDAIKSRSLGLRHFLKNISFFGVYLDCLIGEKNPTTLKLHELVENGIKTGVVQPLPSKVFSLLNQSDAFQLISTGEQIGKVMLKIREEERNVLSNQASAVSVNVGSITQCDPQKSYIITGYVEELAATLASWLIEKGALHLMLNVMAESDCFLVKQLIKSNAIDIQILKENISTLEGAQQLFQQTAEKQGPIGGVFFINASMNDAPIELQTEANFKNTVKNKVEAIQHLDNASRSLCSGLHWFVVLSSFTSRWGSLLQSNHGYANTIIEQIIAKRHSADFPAINLQFCPSVDEKCFSNCSEMEKQCVPSYLKTLEIVLNQSKPIVSSLILPQSTTDEYPILMTVLNKIYGEKNEVNPATTLAQVGADEITVTEIKQILYNYHKNYSAMEVLKMSKNSILKMVSTGK